MIESTFTVTGQLGLHARAAAKVVRVASAFESSLRLERKEGGRSADAKSILSVLMLAAGCGTELRAIAEGPDEEKAIDELGRLFSDGVGEASLVAQPARTERPEMRWKGLGVSDGIAIGRVQRMHNGTDPGRKVA